MYDNKYEKFFQIIESKIRLSFKPTNKEKKQRKKTKDLAKAFKEQEIRDCYGIDCGICPFENTLRAGCLPIIIKKIMEESLKEKIILKDISFKHFFWKKAGEFYLKNYCTEHIQEEMDI